METMSFKRVEIEGFINS